jgi:hypothetical protein
VTIGQLRLKDATGRLSNQLALDFVFQATSPAGGKPLMGGSTSSNTTWGTFETAIGAQMARRTYGSTIPSTFEATQAGSANDFEAGRATYWSFKPNQATFATDTTQHNALRAMLRSVPVGHRFTIINYHEPEDNIASGMFTLAQWKACVQATGEIVDEINTEKGVGSKLRNGICLMGPWTFDTRSNYDTWDWTFTTAQLASIDVVCIDPYRWNPGDPSLELILTRSESGTGTGAATAVMTKLSAWGKPIVLSEWGCTSTGVADANRAAWITAAYAWMKSWNTDHPTGARFEAALYFHNNLDVAQEPRATWELLGSGQTLSKQALIDATADART